MEHITSKWSEVCEAWLSQTATDPAVTDRMYKVAWFMAATVNEKTHEYYGGVGGLQRKLGRNARVRRTLAHLEEGGHIEKLECSEGYRSPPYRMVIRGSEADDAA